MSSMRLSKMKLERRPGRPSAKPGRTILGTIRQERDEFLKIINNRSCHCRNDNYDKIASLTADLKRIANPIRKDIMSTGQADSASYLRRLPGPAAASERYREMAAAV